MRAYKFKQLAEQAANSSGETKYREQLFADLGLEIGPYGGKRVLNRAKQAFDPAQVSLAELSHEFLGRDWRTKIKEIAARKEYYRAMGEAEGTVVQASHFSHISSWNDTVGGLIEAQVMDAYQAPEAIGNDMCTVHDTTVRGGAMIGVRNDGQDANDSIHGSGEDLDQNLPYPTVGLKETRVEIPDYIRNGTTIQVSEGAFIHDRTDQISAMCQNAGYATMRRRELRIARQAMGLVNNYQRDGVSSNTYQATADVIPNDYVNSKSIQLEDWTDINEAWNVLQNNSDPTTGFEIAIPLQRLIVLVAPFAELNVRHMLRAADVGVLTASLAQRRYDGNPLPAMEVKSSVIWWKEWVNAQAHFAPTSENNTGPWWLGDWPKANRYQQILPFEVFETVLSTEDQRRDIIAAYICREWGVPFTAEPRYEFYSSYGA